MPNWPKLSEILNPVVNLFTCQSCGKEDRVDLPPQRWQECDDDDKPTLVVVLLCKACAESIIEPHPRLYTRLHYNQPFPGVMPVCDACIHRQGPLCTHHSLRANGGPGLEMKFPQPSIALVHGKGFGGPVYIWHGPVSCEGQELWNA